MTLTPSFVATKFVPATVMVKPPALGPLDGRTDSNAYAPNTRTVMFGAVYCKPPLGETVTVESMKVVTPAKLFGGTPASVVLLKKVSGDCTAGVPVNCASVCRLATKPEPMMVMRAEPPA